MQIDKLTDMQRYLLEEEVENLQKHRINRREFTRRIALMVGGSAAASLLVSLGCTQEDAAGTADMTALPDLATGPGAVGVAEDDPAIRASAVVIPHANGAFSLTGYKATPAAVPQDTAILLIIHENRALTPYIKDVVRRWAKAGYVALCVDLLSRLGGSAAFPDEATRPAALGQITTDQALLDLSAGIEYLKSQPGVKGERLGVTGFCFGGGYTWRVATQRTDVRAAVSFYGPNPPLQDVPKITAKVLGIYGALDTRITGTVGDLENALKMANITHQIKIYEGADHAFHNDTGTRYQPEAARDAWQRSLGWFAMYL